MVRLIDADAFLKEYCEPYPHIYQAMSSAFKHAPKVDAEPVRHGKWFLGTAPYFVCSECKNRTPLRWDERLGYVLDYRSPYCPNCGAKMDAERKEE